MSSACSHATNGGIEQEAAYFDAAAQVTGRVAAAPLNRFAELYVLAAECCSLALNLGGALHGPEQHEGGGDISLADRDPVVAQHQHVLVAQARQHAAALVGVESRS